MLAPIHIALRTWRSQLTVPMGAQRANHEDHERILGMVRAGHRVAATDAATTHVSTVFEPDMRTALAPATSHKVAG